MKYHLGCLKTVADALSHRDSEATPEEHDATAAATLSSSSFAYINYVHVNTVTAPDAQLLQEHLSGKSIILIVVDCFSKYAHFIALGHPYTAASIAYAFFDGIVRLHGFPTSIVSDQDPCSPVTCGTISLRWWA